MSDYRADDVFGFSVMFVLVLIVGLAVGGAIGYGAGYNAAQADIYQKASGMVDKDK